MQSHVTRPSQLAGAAVHVQLGSAALWAAQSHWQYCDARSHESAPHEITSAWSSTAASNRDASGEGLASEASSSTTPPASSLASADGCDRAAECIVSAGACAAGEEQLAVASVEPRARMRARLKRGKERSAPGCVTGMTAPQNGHATSRWRT
jgi:hypothetical protein